MSDTIEIDGSQGEGGGQILRTALALACVTGTPVQIERIRAGRAKPGLMRQHRTSVLAAARVSNAMVEGAELGSTSLSFHPGPIVPGVFEFDIGTAGATGLVLQTILQPLLRASGPSSVRLTGGTHVPAAPSFTFLRETFTPCLERIGASWTLAIERAGYYPVGGGRVRAEIVPTAVCQPLHLDAEAVPDRMRAIATTAQLPHGVGGRELRRLGHLLSIEKPNLHERDDRDSIGPGNVLHVEVPMTDGRTQVFTVTGRRGVSAEEVATQLATEVCAFVDAKVAACEHLADQLLLPLALGAGGSFTTTAPTEHTRTNAAVIRRFLDVAIRFEEIGANRHRVTVEPSAGRGRRDG